MKDILLPLRDAYYEKLSSPTLILYNEGAVPDGAVTPYIVMANQISIENSNKAGFGHKSTMVLDIITSIPIATTEGNELVDVLAAQILEVVNSKTEFIINEDFQSVSLKLAEDKKLSSVTATERIFRRLLKFEHIIRQLN